ncbi:ATP-binding protein [Roseibium sp. RKSG952]|uniref:ATP-binding protein n=1 Tax=Roseibium sp. RKSG952 TaxID=2529384 RepID=UPI0012BD2B52|nr:ATP-binding protein [Roseibium sp. RKSG952]MTH94756.1 ATP-binding protein [Roseibium sp. RKSG952]
MNTETPDTPPGILLSHHLKTLKLPTFLREYQKLARQCATEGVDHTGYLARLAEREMAACKLLIIDELGFVPLSKTGAELLFELISQRYERGASLITSNLPFDEWTETLGSERLTGARLDRVTHHVNILEMNGDSFRLAQSRARKAG